VQGERSARVLALTEDMIGFNKADYTAWQVRWECLCAMQRDLKEEYAFTDGIMAVSQVPSTYTRG
jgi:protein farnesyltransferase/geranylgeranyltransferase type-1 subunit alpha